MTARTQLSAVALAAATFTMLAASGSASANPVRGLGHGPVVTAGGPTGAGVQIHQPPINPSPTPPPSQNGGSDGNGHLVSCHPGTGCTVTGNGDRDRDHDHDHDHDHDRDHEGYYHRGYGWGYQPPIVVEGVPGAVAVPAPVQAVPTRVPVPAAQMAQGPCNCLTKRNQPDGSVLFQDICTKESAIAPPQAAGAR